MYVHVDLTVKQSQASGKALLGKNKVTSVQQEKLNQSLVPY